MSITVNQPPVVSGIPGETVTTPDPFTPIALDNYVTDPDHADNQLTWSVSGNTRLGVSIVNRVATITYPPDTTSSFTEVLTFRATDPGGLSGSAGASFSVLYQAVDYIPRPGGFVDDSRVISAAESVMQRVASIRYSISAPGWARYELTGAGFISATELQVDFRISVDANAPPGTGVVRVENELLDSNGQVLGPLSGAVFNFRIQVTP